MADYKSSYTGAQIDTAVKWVRTTLNVTSAKIANGAVTLAKLATTVQSYIMDSFKSLTITHSTDDVSLTLAKNGGSTQVGTIEAASSTQAGIMTASQAAQLQSIAEGDFDALTLTVITSDSVSDYDLSSYAMVRVKNKSGKLVCVILPKSSSTDVIGYLLEGGGSWRVVTQNLTWDTGVTFSYILQILTSDSFSIELTKIGEMYAYMQSQGWVE